LRFVVDGFGETDDGWGIGSLGQIEEGAAAFGTEELAQGVGVGYGLTFVIIPEEHVSSDPVGATLGRFGIRV
jgi:hypothetical protein